MVVIISLIVIGLIILIVSIWVFIAIKKSIETKNNQRLILINSIASLAAIVGLLITLFVFNFDLYEKEQEKLKRFSALKFELKINRENFNLIVKTIQNKGIPETRYEINILESMLQSGEIPKNELVQYWNSYILMKTSNNLLDKALTIQFYEHIADPRDMISRSGRRQKIAELIKWIEDNSNTTISILENLINKQNTHNNML